MTTATIDSTFAISSARPVPAGFVSGAPRVLLRIEGALVLAFAALGYAHLGSGWGLFAALFLAPDLAFFGYLAGPRVGAIAYNATHSYVGPALVGAAAIALGAPTSGLALIWASHVGFDRALGYGLKYGSAFGATHLGRIGKSLSPE